ncbi:hypothetical protein D3C71_2039990 [compost metagenome]
MRASKRSVSERWISSEPSLTRLSVSASRSPSAWWCTTVMLRTLPAPQTASAFSTNGVSAVSGRVTATDLRLNSGKSSEKYGLRLCWSLP